MLLLNFAVLSPGKFCYLILLFFRQVIKSEVDSSVSSPVINVVPNAASPSSSSFNTINVITTKIKSSPPPSPSLGTTPVYSPSSPHQILPTSPVTIQPFYKVVSVCTNGAKNDVLSRAPNSGITKTKKIQPKVTLKSVPAEGIFSMVPNGTFSISNGTAGAHRVLSTSPVSTHLASTGSTHLASTGSTHLASTGGNNQTILGNISSNPSVSLLQQAKLQKRHERMIKNRESASLSRKKKKEYVTNLESELTEVKSQNKELREEVERLRHQLNNAQQECSDLRKKITSGVLKRGGNFLSSRAAGTMLLTVFCLLAINFPLGISPHWTHKSDPILLDKKAIDKPSLEELSISSRHLLWADYDDSLNESSYFNSTMCSSLLNETESLRLESELRDWFDMKHSSNWHLRPRNSLSVPPQPIRRRMSRRKKNIKKSEASSRRDNSMKALSTRHAFPSVYQNYLYRNSPLTIEPSQTGLVDGPPPPLSLLEVLQQTQDTYYVVSFSQDLLLVPASVHNSSSRPKMTLLLPTPVNSTKPNEKSNENSHMAMMKIDCEVLSTSNLNVAPPAPKHEKNDTAEDYEGDLYKVQPNDQFPLKGREEKGKKGHFYPLKGREERISKDFNSEAAYDQFESVYKEGHLEDVVQFPHHLHPKNINRISKAKSVTNKTSAAKGNDLQNDYKK